MGIIRSVKMFAWERNTSRLVGERREEDGGEGQKSKEPQALGSEGRTYIKQGSGTERKGMVEAQG